MSDVQTQVVDQSQIGPNEYDIGARVQQFKQALSDIRAIRVGIVEKMRGIVAGIKEQTNSRDHMVAMFKSEATQMFPALVVRDAWEFADSDESPFQLAQLKQVYLSKLDPILRSIDVLVAQYNEMYDKDQSLAAEEQHQLKLYGYFAASTPGTPSPEALHKELQYLDVIPSVEEGNVYASVSALEDLPEETADMVTLQAVTMETGYDTEAVNKSLMDNMIESQTSHFQQGVDPVQGIKTWHMVLAGAALLYILL